MANVSIVDFGEDWSVRQASQAVTNGVLVTTARRRFNVRTDGDIGEFSLLVLCSQLVNKPIPSVGDGFPDPAVNYLVVNRVWPQRDTDDPLSWFIDVDYSDLPGLSVSSGDPERPWLNPPTIAVDNSSIYVAFTKDAMGVAVLSSAGSPMDCTTQLPIKIITVTRSVQAHNPAVASAAEGTINANAVTICGYAAADYCAKLVKWVGIPNYTPKAKTKYYVETIVFHVIIGQVGTYKKTWRREILDQDVYYLNGGVKARIQIKGQDACTPQLLDGNGGILAIGGTPVYHTYYEFVTGEANWPTVPAAL